MKIISSFKTKTNENNIARVEVIYLESHDESYEDAIIIQTTRLIKASEFDTINRLNVAFPMFFSVRETKNYALVVTRNAPIKLSTLDKINEVINDYKTKKL